MEKEVLLLDMECLKNLVYIYFLLHPNMTARRIYAIWYKSNVLGEYNRPEVEILLVWIEEFKAELTQMVVQRLEAQRNLAIA